MQKIKADKEQQNLKRKESVQSLGVIGSDNQTSILSFSTDSDHVEMATGRTLEEEYMGVLDGMSQEYTSTGGAITVNDALESRLVGATIEGQTVKNIQRDKYAIGGSGTTYFLTEKVDYTQLIANSKYTIVFPNKHSKINRVFFSEAVSQTNDITNKNYIVITTKNTVNNPEWLHFYTSSELTEQELSEIKKTKVLFLEGDLSNIAQYIAKYIPFGLSSTQAQITCNGHTTKFYEPILQGQTRILSSTGEEVEAGTTGARLVSLEPSVEGLPKLGSVPSIADTIDRASGIITENTKEILLDGSGWTKFSDYLIYKTLSDANAIHNSYISCVCDKFETTAYSSAKKGALCMHTNKNLEYRLLDGETFEQATNKLKDCTLRYACVPIKRQLTPDQLKAYDAHKKQILLHKVGDVADTLEMMKDGSGVWNRNNNIYTFTGNETITNLAANLGNVTRAQFEIDFITKTQQGGICNMLPTLVDFVSDNEHIYFANANSRVYLFIGNQKLNGKTISEYLKELHDNGNPLVICANLNTPTTTHIHKSVNEPVLTDKINNLEAGEAVLPSSFTVKLPTTSSIKKQFAQTLLNNYTGTASANLLKDGRVQLDMTVAIPSTFNQTVFSLPEILRPKVARKVMGFNGNNPVTLLVGTDGTVKIPTAITGTVELCDEYDL